MKPLDATLFAFPSELQHLEANTFSFLFWHVQRPFSTFKRLSVSSGSPIGRIKNMQSTDFYLMYDLPYILAYKPSL